MSDPVIAVCMPMARGAHPSTMRCLLSLDIPRPYHFFDLVGFQVDVARNMVTEAACNFADVTHILWIDDDMTFEPGAVRRLLAHELPIVGGLCFGRRHPYPPILIHETARGFSFDYNYPKDQLVEVDATGAAFLLVKKEVFFKIHEQFKEGPWTPIGVGEDVSFCRRARHVGYKVFVDTSVKIGHVGEMVFEADSAKRNRMFEVNPWFPPCPIAEGDPRATIVIPTFDQKPERLRAAVESAMSQTVPVEIIVVDNGSHSCIWCDKGDATSNHLCPDAPKHPHLKILRIEENAGSPWAALNLGIKEMTTKWFTWLSSDDLLYPHKVERQLRAMGGSVDCYASFHGYDLMLHDWGISQTVVVPIAWKTREEAAAHLAQNCYINGLTAMIHREVFETVGQFDTSFVVSADWELWNRIAQHFFWLPIEGQVLATRREYDNASRRYAQDPKMREVWAAEDARIRAMYRQPSPEDLIGHDLEDYSDAETGEENIE